MSFMKKNARLILCFCLVIVAVITIILAGNFNKKGSLFAAEVSLGKYIGVEAEVYETVVTDGDVENAIIDNIVASQEDAQITNRPVRSGDTANIDYLGKIDGEAFEGGTATGYDLGIGSGNFIDGFEDQIIGMKVGETADIKVTFPDPYYNNTAMSGAEAVFTVTINSISGKILPNEITDEMIQELSDIYTTVGEYREYVRIELEAKAESTNMQNKQEAVWKIIAENSTVENLSEEKVNYYSSLFEDNYQYYADMYGMDLATFINSYMGITEEEFNEYKKEYGENAVTQYAIVEAIAKKEDMSISDNEYQTYLEENSVSDEEKEQYGGVIRDEMLYKKVIEFVTSNAQIAMLRK